MVDGLGHGEQAQIAAEAAIEHVSRHLEDPIHKIFESCDRAIRHTRGVAMSLILIDNDCSTLTHAGIGNVNSMVYGRLNLRLGGDWGIVGGGYRKLNPQTLDIHTNDLVLMWTDGISEHFILSDYGYDAFRNERILADTILHDHGKLTDDATILIYRRGLYE